MHKSVCFAGSRIQGPGARRFPFEGDKVVCIHGSEFYADNTRLLRYFAIESRIGIHPRHSREVINDKRNIGSLYDVVVVLLYLLQTVLIINGGHRRYRIRPCLCSMLRKLDASSRIYCTDMRNYGYLSVNLGKSFPRTIGAPQWFAGNLLPCFR